MIISKNWCAFSAGVLPFADSAPKKTTADCERLKPADDSSAVSPDAAPYLGGYDSAPVEPLRPRVRRFPLALVTAAVCLGAPCAWGDGSPASLEAHYSSRAIHPGERLRLEIRLPSKLAPTVKSENEEEPELPVVNDDLLASNKDLQVLDKDYRREKDTLVWRYDLTSYQLGKLSIPPLSVKLGANSFSTEGTEIEVNTTRRADDEAIREEYGAMPLPIQWRWLLRVLAAVVLVGAAAWAWSRYGRRFHRRKHHHVVAPVVPEENPMDWLRARLAVLRGRLDQATIVDELSGTLREYYARRFHQPVRAWTTREFRTRFNTDSTAKELSSVLDRCDEYKFTGTTAHSPRDLASRGIEESERILCGT